MSFITGITQRGCLPLVEAMVAFTEARHGVIAENIANIDTPGYRTKQLDPAAFQAELRRAASSRKSPTDELRLCDSRPQKRNSTARLTVTPELEPPENLTFQDGTNASIERQMAMLAENATAHQTSVELLRSGYGALMTAIRGRVG